MSPSRRRGRRVPPRARGAGPAMPPGAYGSGGAGGTVPEAPRSPSPEAPRPQGDAGESATRSLSEPVRPISRSSNRAAKRAASGRPPSGSPRQPAKRPSSTGPLLALGAVAAAVVVGVIAFGNPFGGGASASASPGASAGASAAVYGDGTCPTSQPDPLGAGETRTVTIKTDKGDIVMEIDGALSPIATGNFIALASCHYYDGVVFHRLVPGFVIQGGDPDGTGSGRGPGYSIEDDPLTTSYHRGTVAMARTSRPDSQGSQFFIVLADDADKTLKSSQYPYAILGEVTSGMDVVDAIAAMPNTGPNDGNAAVDPVEMVSVTVSNGPAASGSPAPSASPGATTAAPAASPAPTQ